MHEKHPELVLIADSLYVKVDDTREECNVYLQYENDIDDNVSVEFLTTEGFTVNHVRNEVGRVSVVFFLKLCLV